MSRTIIILEDFLDQPLRDRIDREAAALGFTTRWYQSASDIGTAITEAEILFGNGFLDLLRKASSLRWYCSSFAGVELYMDPSVWPEQPCLFTNSSGAYGVTISEHIVMVLLMLLRRMPEYQQGLARREWPFLTPVRSVKDLQVTILGMGDIGTHTARSLSAMGAVVRGVRRDPSKPADSAFREMWATADLDKLLPETEALIMALPSTPSTSGILNRERIALLPQGAYVVNVGRGDAVDQEALCQALNSGHLGGAALDVMVPEPLPVHHPLWDARNMLITPHCSGNTALGYSRSQIVEMFLDNLTRYAAGQPLLHLVDKNQGY